MRKWKAAILTICLMICVLLMNHATAFASNGTEGGAIGDTLSLAYCIPFAGILLSIAVAPLINANFWDKYKQYAVIFWSLLFIVPFTIFVGPAEAWEQLMEVVVGDYITFIVLLFGLFCVTGNIRLGGRLGGKPFTNVIMLLIGTLLSSWIGTTGASMLLIRPIIRANKWRKRKVQVVIFFIFLISNMGGCLTPVGDPPLLMGFANGVDFTWSFRLFPIFALNIAILLIMFFVMDNWAYKKDLAAGMEPPEEESRFYVNGAHNIIFLIMIVGAVILSGVLPKMIPLFASGIKIYKQVTMEFATVLEVVIILLAALLSFKTTKAEIREKNCFSWGPIQEVAILFIGIFITMIPALLILKANGNELGLDQPWQFFWMTGILSSFLDNTPTYLVFFTTAASMGFTEGIKVTMGYIPQTILMAISCGAVFMGANTYIGNAPNFMVRSIAEENDIKMPSFFGYMLWSFGCLMPVFIIDTLLFFM